MLTIEMRVNGSVVSAITAINRGHEKPGVCRYEYQAVAFPMDNTGLPHVQHGEILHKRDDGIELLTAKLCTLVGNTIKKGAK